MSEYKLIRPDGIESGIHVPSGEQGRIFVQRFCRHNADWTWREIEESAAITELQIEDAVHKSKADT